MKRPSAQLRTLRRLRKTGVAALRQSITQQALILVVVFICWTTSATADDQTLFIGHEHQTGAPQQWNELTIAQFQRAQAQGHMNAEQLTRYYIQRIQALNEQGPQLRAVLELNPKALAHAKALDQERQSQGTRSALHGVPVLLKANISTAGPMATHSGSAALAGHIAAKDTPLVRQLTAAGAVILGTSNLSEWANFRGQSSSSGWSSLGGQTRNPYVLNRSPCGSSSGSGSAISANLALLAVGTETNGSIVCPSAINGIVGIKPTHGAVSGEGIIPIATSQDIAGPMARTVADAAVMLDTMLTPEAKARINTSLQEQAKPGSLKGVRIGVVSYFAANHPKVQAIIQQAAAQAAAAGAVIVDIPEWSLEEQTFADFFYVLKYEFKRDVEAWLGKNQYPNGMRQLRDIISFNQRHADSVMPFYGQEYLEQAESIDLQAELERWQAARRYSREQAQALIDNTQERYQLDAIALPTNGPAWLIDHLNGDRFDLSSSFAAANAGYPAITIPVGFLNQLPIGMSLVGSAWQEAHLVHIAASWEQQLQARQPPQFIPSLEALNQASRYIFDHAQQD